MMTSDQIAQQHSHAFRMGYGANPGQSSYEPMSGLTPFGHGAGSQAGVSAMQSAASLANTSQLVGLGAMGGGFLLKTLGLGSSAAATGLGRVATWTGVSAPAALSMGVIMPAIAALGAAATGAQRYAQTQNIMDQSFGTRVGAGGAFGYGVSRQAALSMNNMMQQMALVPEMMTDFGELQNAMQKVTQMGLMQGVRDAKEFKSKFSAMTTALREMSKSLGSTIEEALPFLQSSVRQGFLDPQQIQRNVQGTAGASSVGIGMQRNRMMQLQEQGAGIIGGFGGDMRVGAAGVRDYASTLSVALKSGAISEQELSRITGGKIGEEGVEALSKMALQGQARMFQSGPGRFITAALAERDKEGNFTGKLNQDMLERFRAGQVGGGELMAQGNRALDSLTTDQAISFMNAMDRGLGAEAAAMSGVAGTSTAIRAILEGSGVKSKEAQKRLIARLTGMSQSGADTLLRITEQASDIIAQQQAEFIQATERDLSVAFFKENRTFKGALHHAQAAAVRTFIDPFQRAGAGAASRFGDRMDELSMRFMAGDLGTKANMILNPIELVGNAGQLFFGNQSHYDMSAGAKMSGISHHLLNQKGAQLSKAPELSDVAKGLHRARGSSMLGAVVSGAIGGGLVGAYGGAVGGLAGIAGGGLAGMGYGAYRAYTDRGGAQLDYVKSIFGGSLDEKYAGPREQSAGSKKKLDEYLLQNGLSYSDLKTMSRDKLAELAKSVGIKAMLQAGPEGIEAAEALRDMFSALGEEGASSEDLADIRANIDETFHGGVIDSLFDDGGMQYLSGEKFIVSEGMKSMMLGGARSRSALMKILSNEGGVRGQLMLHSGNKESIERLRKQYGLEGASIEDLTNAATSMYNAQLSDSDYEELHGRLSGYSKVLDKEERRASRFALSDTFKSIFGEGAEEAMRGGLGAAHGSYKDLESSKNPLSRQGKMMLDAFKANQLRGLRGQKDVSREFAKLGITNPSSLLDFDNDDALNEGERERANAALAMARVTSQLTAPKMGRSATMASQMGVAQDLAEKAHTIYQETMRVQTAYNVAIGRALPAVNEAARVAEAQSNGAQTRSDQ